MRAREFINESKRTTSLDNFSRAHPGLVGPTGIEQLYTSRAYDFYKISVLAGLSDEDLANTDISSYLGNLPMYSAYTEEEHKKIYNALKKLGLDPTDYIPSGSKETADTNSISPVKAFKGYK